MASMTRVYSLREESRLNNNGCRTGLYTQHGLTDGRIFRRAGELRIFPLLTRGFYGPSQYLPGHAETPVVTRPETTEVGQVGGREVVTLGLKNKQNKHLKQQNENKAIQKRISLTH